MLFFWCYILLPYYSFIYWKILYINTTEYNNIDILKILIRQYNNLYKLWYIDKTYIYRTHIHTYTHTHVRTRTHTYIYIHIYTYTYILNTYTFYQYIMCQNCIKIHLNHLKYHFNFNTLIICVSLCYTT